MRRSGVTASGFRADIERTAVFFADSRLWLGGNLRCLWWKRVALDSDKEGLVQKNGFGFVKKAAFECRLESFSTKKKRFCFAKKACFFSL